MNMFIIFDTASCVKDFLTADKSEYTANLDTEFIHRKGRKEAKAKKLCLSAKRYHTE